MSKRNFSSLIILAAVSLSSLLIIDIVTICKAKTNLYGIKYNVLILMEEDTGEWVPGEPMQIAIDAIYDDEGKTLSIVLTLIFKHGGFKVNWGKAILKGDEISIYTEVLEYTGPSVQVITVKGHVYNISDVDPGIYVVKLYVNNKLYSKVQITAESPTGNEWVDDINRNRKIVTIASAIALTALLFLMIYKSRRKIREPLLLPKSR